MIAKVFIFLVTVFLTSQKVVSAEKRIEVDKTAQRIYLFEDQNRRHEFAISTGKMGYNTPNGEFKIWKKVAKQKMSGGSKEKGDYYYLPGVPWIMFFYNEKIPKYKGYAVHGAYWHRNFGRPISRGCVNVKPEEAKIVYDWAQEGTKVVVYGEFDWKAYYKSKTKKT